MSAVDASTVKAFTRILRSTQSNPLEGTAFRAVQEKYRESPLSAVGSIRVGGRYNPKGLFEALYLAETAQSALSEVAFGITSGGKFINTPHSPYIVLSITFFLQKVLQLEGQLTRLGLFPEQLALPWRPIQQSGGLALTQALGIRDWWFPRDSARTFIIWWFLWTISSQRAALKWSIRRVASQPGWKSGSSVNQPSRPGKK